MARITVDELHRLIAEGQRPVIVDLRTSLARDQDGRFIPGAVIADFAEVDQWLDQVPMDREVIFYCTCPNEAGAAHVARKLMDLGYTRVRPLLGGLDAWIAAGYQVESRSVAQPERRLSRPYQPFSAPREGRDPEAYSTKSTDYACNAHAADAKCGGSPAGA